MASPARPIVLHIGDPIKYNPETYALLSARCTVVRPGAAERERGAFMRALRERRWGDFDAIFRPFWGSGGEMGRWDAELIGLLPDSVRVFASAGAGFDWADTELLGKKGIIYCNGGLAAAESVADFAVAMVISTFRHLPWAMSAATMPYAAAAAAAAATTTTTTTTTTTSSSSSSSSHQRDAEAAFRFSHDHTTAHARNPRGHALGLIGLGRIGQLVAAKLGNPSMGMAVHYTDVARKPAGVERRLGATFHPTLRGLLGASDCVVVCAPAAAAPGAAPLVGAECLGWLRPGARLVNIARGSLVDEDALAAALESGRVSAAALDVHADEPRVSPRLLRLAGTELAAAGAEGGRMAGGAAVNPGRVMLTCHNAGGTVETHIGFEELAMRNILAVVEGREAITPVNMHFLETNKKMTTTLRGSRL